MLASTGSGGLTVLGLMWGSLMGIAELTFRKTADRDLMGDEAGFFCPVMQQGAGPLHDPRPPALA